MAVTRLSTTDRWQGLSTDQKPYPARGSISSLASFLEIDTGRLFYWTGTSWVEETPEVRELRDIKGLLGVIVEHLNASL